MKDILGDNLEGIKSDILCHLSSISGQFSDKTLLKAIKIQTINAEDEDWDRRKLRIHIENLKESIEKYEKYDIKMLSRLYLSLLLDDYHEASHILNLIDYNQLNPEIVKKISLLRNLSRVMFLENNDELISAVIKLLETDNLPLDFNFSILLFEFFYRDEDCEKDYLYEMGETILSYRPDCYDAYSFLGFLKNEMKEYLGSLDSYFKCFEFAPSDHLAWISLRMSDVYLSLQEYEKVIEYSNQALAYFDRFNRVTENSHEKLFFSTIYTLRSQGFMGIQDYKLAMGDIEQGLTYDDEHIHLTNLQEIVEKHMNK